MHVIKKFAAAAIAVVAAISPAAVSAQGSAGEISVRVLCFEYRNDITSVVAAGDRGGSIPIPLYTSGFSEPVKAKFVGGKAALYTEEAAADGKMELKLVAEGKLAEGTRQAFLLIPTDAATGAVYRIVAFPDGEDVFPMGATRVLNLAPFPIRLNLAGSDMDPIKPGGIGMYPMVKKTDDWNMYTARIKFGVAEGQWVDVSTQSWKSSDRKRDWVITRFDAATKQPVVRLYQDIPPWRQVALPTP